MFKIRIRVFCFVKRKASFRSNLIISKVCYFDGRQPFDQKRKIATIYVNIRPHREDIMKMRLFVTVKKKTAVTAVALIVLLAVMTCAVGFSDAAPVFFGGTTRKIPVYCVACDDDGDKVIALTFDAAWGADKTQGIIDILDEYGAKGTFFLVGFWIEKYSDEVKAISDAGLDIGNHSENHLNMPRMSVAAIKDEIASVNQRVLALTGKTPVYFRAPFGDYDNKLMTALEDMSMTGVQWSIDSLDWKGLGAKDIVERIVPKAKSGDIVLFHNNSDHVLDALPIVLTALKNKGFRFVALSELVATENYTVDSAGVQHKTT